MHRQVSLPDAHLSFQNVREQAVVAILANAAASCAAIRRHVLVARVTATAMHDVGLMHLYMIQVAAAARERADIAEQRLSQRLEMAQQRDQHASDLLQVHSCCRSLHRLTKLTRLNCT